MLAKSLAFLSNGNTIKTIGNDNIAIQGVRNSNITINNIAEIKTAFEEAFQSSNNTYLYFLVLADFSKIKPHEWQPFGNEKLLSMIGACTQSLRANVVVWYLDTTQVLPKGVKSEVENIKAKAILVLDTNTALDSRVLEWFDSFSIGGCIALPSIDT